MSEQTDIDYLDSAWNPVVGCTPASPGCAHCYAKAAHDRRHGAHLAGKTMPKQYAQPFYHVQCLKSRLDQPLAWRAPRSVGVCFGGDLFHEQVPDDFIGRVFDGMSACPRHRFLVPTKRVARMRGWVTRNYTGAHRRTTPTGIPMSPLENVLLGGAVEDQPRADERLPDLVKMGEQGWRTWVSLEPLLGAVDVSQWLYSGYARPPQMDRVLWVVVGGESGPGARRCDVAWIRSIVSQCRAAEVPCFVKQLGARGYRVAENGTQYEFGPRVHHDPDEWPADLQVRQMPEGWR